MNSYQKPKSALKPSLTEMFLEAEAKERAAVAELDILARQKFEKALDELDEEFKPWTDTIHDSERLSEDDFAMHITTSDVPLPDVLLSWSAFRNHPRWKNHPQVKAHKP